MYLMPSVININQTTDKEKITFVALTKTNCFQYSQLRPCSVILHLIIRYHTVNIICIFVLLYVSMLVISLFLFSRMNHSFHLVKFFLSH